MVDMRQWMTFLPLLAVPHGARAFFVASARCTASKLGLATANRRSPPRRIVPALAAAGTPAEGWAELVMPDYLIFDSDEYDGDGSSSSSATRPGRPNLATFLLTKPRNLLATALLLDGISVTALNVAGEYGDAYLRLTVAGAVLGLANAAVDLAASLPPHSENVPTEDVSPNVRAGAVDDALLHVYSSVYTAAASWLAVRTSLVCPGWLPPLDAIVGPGAGAVFAFSLAAPLLTLVNDSMGGPDDADRVTVAAMPLRMMVGGVRQRNPMDVKLPSLTETELLRAKGLLAIGVVACLYVPEVLSFMLLGQAWWLRAVEAFPGQAWVESSNALFGVFATQASMIAHRAGKAGVAPFRVVVPAFAGVCFFLTVLPCASAFYWWGDKISFFEFYKV